MSALYNLEPQPTAKVLLQTTSGDILLELFAKQVPLACRNFLQLCLDGYYNGTIFHRLVPGFVVQGGDPTGTGEGGEAIYDGGLFADEFHSRLKFNRRGLLGMANTGRKDDNGSQFFITLGKTEELNGKNTMFGRVVGDTIYNLMRIGEAELTDIEGSERPIYPTKVTGTEVLVTPFDDMVARKLRAKPLQAPIEAIAERKKPKKKGRKALLSFGADEEDMQEAPVIKKPKFNSKVVKTRGESMDDHPVSKAKRASKSLRAPRPTSRSPPTSPVSKLNIRPETQLPLPNDEEPQRSASASPESDQSIKASSALERTNAQIAELKVSMKRNNQPAVPQSSTKKSALEQMIPVNSVRGRKRKHGTTANAKGDAQALEMLNSFRTKLDHIQPKMDRESNTINKSTDTNMGEIVNSVGAEDEEARLCDLHFIANCQSCMAWDEDSRAPLDGEDENGDQWMLHVLSFEKDRLGKDLKWKKNNEEELVIIDPREKAKEIQAEQKAKKALRGSQSNRVWDKDRDRGRLPEKMNGER